METTNELREKKNEKLIFVIYGNCESLTYAMKLQFKKYEMTEYKQFLHSHFTHSNKKIFENSNNYNAIQQIVYD